MMLGKESSPGYEKLPASVTLKKRLKPTRNSFSTIGEKVWNSPKVNR